MKILFLAANPTDSTRLRLDEEARTIDQTLQRTRLRDEFETITHWAVRVSDLQNLLLRHEPNLIHFSGHGNHLGEIFLEDESGTTKTVPSSALSKLFSLSRNSVKCVILNACFSEVQANAIAEQVGYVIGMPAQITDKAAILFASAFYQALGFGKDVQDAFHAGCVELDLHNLGEENTPKLVNKVTTNREEANRQLGHQQPSLARNNVSTGLSPANITERHTSDANAYAEIVQLGSASVSQAPKVNVDNRQSTWSPNPSTGGSYYRPSSSVSWESRERIIKIIGIIGLIFYAAWSLFPFTYEGTVTRVYNQEVSDFIPVPFIGGTSSAPRIAHFVQFQQNGGKIQNIETTSEIQQALVIGKMYRFRIISDEIVDYVGIPP